MNALLPIFQNPQPNTNGTIPSEKTAVSLGQASTEPSTTFAQAFESVFPQIVNERGNLPELLKQLQSFISTKKQQSVVSSLSQVKRHRENIEDFVIPDQLANVLKKIQISGVEESPEQVLLAAFDRDGSQGLASLLSTLPAHIPLADPNEFVSLENQESFIGQNALSATVTIPSPSPLQDHQSESAVLVPNGGAQQTAGNPYVESLRQKPRITEEKLGILPQPLQKALEGGTISPKTIVPKAAEFAVIPQDNLKSSATTKDPLGTKAEDIVLRRSDISSAKVALGGLPTVENSVSKNQGRQQLRSPQSLNPLVRPDVSQSHHSSSTAALQAERPAGFSGPSITSQIAGQVPLGNSSVTNEVTGTGKESRTTVPVDLLGETGLLGKGDRVQSVVETSLKSLSADPSGGQGLGNGMSQFSQSQSGFQQSSMFANQGPGLRALEERGQEFPVPALQRLQMDVQVTETQRVQIDVGVQNRQVYAGLIVDHSVLRNLANQFVPQLEHQLHQVDLELKEFSTEVRDERERQSHPMFHDSERHQGQNSERRSPEDASPTQEGLTQQTESKLHFVA